MGRGLSPAVILVIAITLGLPILGCLAIILFTPGVRIELLIVSVQVAAILLFLVAAVFEIKRLADGS